MKRKIVRIDEQKCDGCGLCATACHEGAIAIVDGKARLVSESYCDGLGDCLRECPQDAIRIEEREAVSFDHEAVSRHLLRRDALSRVRQGVGPHVAGAGFSGCPGAALLNLGAERPANTRGSAPSQETPSELGNWPIQLA